VLCAEHVFSTSVSALVSQHVSARKRTFQNNKPQSKYLKRSFGSFFYASNFRPRSSMEGVC
jgi:hypothetical protein